MKKSAARDRTASIATQSADGFMINLKEKILAGWVGERLLTTGRVLEVEKIGKAYRRFSIAVPRLSDKLPALGDKVQIFLPGVGTRTYTPFALTKDHTAFDLLAYVHGSSPASVWAEQLAAGDTLRFVGPQRSLELTSMSSPIALFGDETSLAVARSLLDAHGERAVLGLEVDDIDDAREVCARLELPENCLSKRSSQPYAALAERLGKWSSNGTLVLTGRAQSIQRMRNELRLLNLNLKQKVKPYWSEGKTGLD